MDLVDHRQEDFWTHWGWIWSVLYAIAVVVPLLVGLFSNQIAPNGRLSATLIGLISLGWHYFWTYIYVKRLPNQDFRDRPLVMVFHLFGLAVGWGLLVHISPVFFFSLFGYFGLFFYLLPVVYAIVSVIPFAVFVAYTIALISGRNFQWNDTINILFFFSVLAGCLFSLWIKGIIDQSHGRKELVKALQETRQELAQSERRAGQLEERQRLAQEIHDTLAQGFISIIMNLETAVSLLPPDEKPTHYVNTAAQTARDSLAQARRVVEDLRPAALEQTTSLPEAIERVAERWEKESGTAVSVTITGEPTSLSGKMDVALLRATQEALANVRKHAAAQSVKITLSYMEDVVILDVQDDGRGIMTPTPNATQGGYGLTAMRERVSQFNGTVELESEPNEGTTLMVSIPI